MLSIMGVGRTTGRTTHKERTLCRKLFLCIIDCNFKTKILLQISNHTVYNYDTEKMCKSVQLYVPQPLLQISNHTINKYETEKHNN